MIDPIVWQPAEGARFYYVSWGDSRVYLNPGKAPHERIRPTLHERWSERVNWWLANRVSDVRHRLFDLGRWIESQAIGLCAIEDKLRGWDF